MSESSSSSVVTKEFAEIFLYTSIPVYVAFLVLGLAVGQNAAGSLYMIIVIIGHYALNKALKRHGEMNDKTAINTVSILKSAVPVLTTLTFLHYLSNSFIGHIDAAIGSVTALVVSAELLAIVCKTQSWFSHLENKRSEK